MRVLCINNGDGFAYTRKGKFPTPENMKIIVGEYYTVAEEVVGYKGEMKYRLLEKPSNARYLKKYFAPVSNMDEIEIAKKREGVLVLSP